MLTVDETFRKFKSRLELNDREQKNASDRHNEVRDYLETKFAIERSFLTGSYARYTKTKPLKDIDIFFELKESERHYRSKAPSVILTDFYDALVKKYGSKAVRKQGRSVNVDFGVIVDTEDNTDYRIVSVDVVPAFADGDDYEIPDNDSGKWIKTNPEIHADKATAAHQAFSREWKGLVRMVKYWNKNPRHGEKPVKPSFLIEVMGFECLYGGWQGRFDYELQGLFSTLADRIFDEWPDPAGLGPPVSNGMDTAAKQRARSAHGREPRGDAGDRPCASQSKWRGVEGMACAVRAKVSAFVKGLLKEKNMSAWSLSQLLASLHEDIQSRLAIVRKSFNHPGTKGDASEGVWIDLLENYLPKRYQAATAHVVDSQGNFSQQIDVVVFDRQYSPFIFKYEGQTIIPAESVYAAFEAKQAADASMVAYAQEKVASLRRLHRTSLPIPYAGGTYPAKPLIPILGGLLTFESNWSPALGSSFEQALLKETGDGRLDIGCVAAHGHFFFDAQNDRYQMVNEGKPATAFLFKLIAQLQFSGTVPMIDVEAYGKWLLK